MSNLLQDMQKSTKQIMQFMDKGPIYTLAYYDLSADQMKFTFLAGDKELKDYFQKLDPDKISLIVRNFEGTDVWVVVADEKPIFLLKDNEPLTFEEVQNTLKRIGFSN